MAMRFTLRRKKETIIKGGKDNMRRKGQEKEIGGRRSGDWPSPAGKKICRPLNLRIKMDGLLA